MSGIDPMKTQIWDVCLTCGKRHDPKGTCADPEKDKCPDCKSEDGYCICEYDNDEES